GHGGVSEGFAKSRTGERKSLRGAVGVAELAEDLVAGDAEVELPLRVGERFGFARGEGIGPVEADASLLRCGGNEAVDVGGVEHEFADALEPDAVGHAFFLRLRE